MIAIFQLHLLLLLLTRHKRRLKLAFNYSTVTTGWDCIRKLDLGATKVQVFI